MVDIDAYSVTFTLMLLLGHFLFFQYTSGDDSARSGSKASRHEEMTFELGSDSRAFRSEAALHLWPNAFRVAQLTIQLRTT